MKKIWNLPAVQMMQLNEVEEKRRVALVYSGPAWQAVKERLHLPTAWEGEVCEATTSSWEALRKDFAGEVVYAVGGGLAVDAAKYLAAQYGLPLVAIPTALSVDAFLTAASGIRRDGCVVYLSTKPPEDLILDLSVIAAAPESVRAAGITDVMSIATGCWDWKFAEESGRNPAGMELIPWVYENAQIILQAVLECAEAAGRGDRDGLKTLFDCLAMEVQLCNQIGHARPEEGSEHYFAYCVENAAGQSLPHGELVGPGMLVMARLQGQDTSRYRRALEACNVRLDRIPNSLVTRTLQVLPNYCQKHGLPFGIAHQANMLV